MTGRGTWAGTGGGGRQGNAVGRHGHSKASVHRQQVRERWRRDASTTGHGHARHRSGALKHAQLLHHQNSSQGHRRTASGYGKAWKPSMRLSCGFRASFVRLSCVFRALVSL